MEAIEQQKIKEMAEEIVANLKEGEYIVIRDSFLNPFFSTRDGWHAVYYVAKLKGELMLIDLFYEVLREITKEETIKILIEHLTEYIEYLAEEKNYTKAEIEKHIKDSNPAGKINVCEKHNEVYLEECRQCR